MFLPFDHESYVTFSVLFLALAPSHLGVTFYARGNYPKLHDLNIFPL